MLADLPPSSCATRLTVSRRRLRDQHAGASRAGERHHVDIRMTRDRRADTRTIAVDEIEHARRHAGFMQDVRKQQRTERRVFARLEHHRAARRERGRDLDDDLIDRPVPRRDQAAHADRFEHHARAAPLLFEFETFEHLDQRIQMRGTAHRLAVAGERDGRAHFATHGLGEFVVAAFVDRDDALEQRDTFGDTRRRPGGKRAARGRNCAIDIFGVAHREFVERHFRRRIDDAKPDRGRRFDPTSVDIKLGCM
jgi:hypothetical protein